MSRSPLNIALIIRFCSYSLFFGAFSFNSLAFDEFSYSDKNSPAAYLDRRQSSNERLLRHKIGDSSKSAIAVLSTNIESDVDDLCHALRSLLHLEIASNQQDYPVLVFNEGNLRKQQMRQIDDCTHLTVAYPIVNLSHHYPSGFEPEKEWQEFISNYQFQPIDGREKWSYAQMIRFWTVGIWKHPAIQQFDTVMRIDTDSCFLRESQANPGYEKLPYLDEKYVYQSNKGTHGLPTYVQGLFDHALEYIKKENITPSYPELWESADKLWRTHKNVPLFRTNFEVDRVSFFRREDVMKWHESLSEIEPFGIWRKRWGDAQTRFLTMAIFGSKDSILLSSSVGYVHGRGVCSQYEEEKSVEV